MSEPSTPSPTISPEPPSGGDALRRLVVGLAYGKLLLDVPVFKPGGAEYHVVGERLVEGWALPPTGQCDPDSTLERAGAWLQRSLVSGARFEPENDTPVHRNYPSPRSFFPVQADIVFRDGGAAARIRYEPEHGAFVPVGMESWRSPPGALRFELELVAGLDRIAAAYGDLATTLCALEAGHMAGQLAATLAGEGLDPSVRAVGTPPIHHPSQGLPETDVILARIACEAFQAEIPGAEAFSTGLRVSTPILTDPQHRRVLRAVANLSCDPVADVAVCTGDPGSSAGARRTSGFFPHGMHGAVAAPGLVDSLEAQILEALDRPLRECGVALGCTLLRAQPDLSVLSTRAGGDRRSARIAGGCTLLSNAYGTAFNIDLQTIPLIAIFSAPFATVLREGRTWRYIQTLVSAGSAAQSVCAAAERLDCFARPFKGAVEQQLEASFGIDGQAFYTVLIGRNGAANPAFTLAPPTSAG